MSQNIGDDCYKTPEEVEIELNHIRELNWPAKMQLINRVSAMAALGIICKNCFTRVTWAILISENEVDPNPYFQTILADIENCLTGAVDDIQNTINKKDS